MVSQILIGQVENPENETDWDGRIGLYKITEEIYGSENYLSTHWILLAFTYVWKAYKVIMNVWIILNYNS